MARGGAGWGRPGTAGEACAAAGGTRAPLPLPGMIPKPHSSNSEVAAFLPTTYNSTRLSFPCGHLGGKKLGKSKPPPTSPTIPPPLPEAGRRPPAPKESGPNMGFLKGARSPWARQNRGPYPSRPLGPGGQSAAASWSGDAGRAPGPAGTR